MISVILLKSFCKILLSKLITANFLPLTEFKFSKCLDKIDKHELNGFTLSEEDISSLCQDLNTTKYIADINKAFNDKQYLLVIKMLDFIGIDLVNF